MTTHRGESVRQPRLADVLCDEAWEGRWSPLAETNVRPLAEGIERVLMSAGYIMVRDEPDHYVTFDQNGWFVEHSIACRIAGALGTCGYNAAVRAIAEDFDSDEDSDQLGRWRITDIVGGLPSLERAEHSGGTVQQSV